MHYNEIHIGKQVAVCRKQDRLGGPKYPGRRGVVVEENTVGKFGLNKTLEGLWYVKLEATSRAKERVESFWSKQLEEPQAQPQSQHEPANAAQY